MTKKTNNTLDHLQNNYNRNGKKVSPITLPKDLTPESVKYLSTISFPHAPHRAQIKAYLKSWVNERNKNASFEEAHNQGKAAVKRSYDLSNAQHLVRLMKQAGVKFQK